MAEFSKLVITKAGQALIAKVLEGTAKDVDFTKVAASKATFTVDELELLTALPDVMQEEKISYKTRTNDVTLQIETAFNNTKLTVGYPMNTLGLFAVDPDDGEILYAACAETSGYCYMPPYNGLTVSGAYIRLITTVGNADNVSLEVNPAANATFADVQRLQKQIDELAKRAGVPVFVGATEPDVAPALWFNTGEVPDINTVVFWELGGDSDESDILAGLDGKNRPVMNAIMSGTTTDHMTIEIMK